MINRIYWSAFNSKIGTIYVASTQKGVCKISIPGHSKKDFIEWLHKHFNSVDMIESAAKNKKVIDQLNRYFDRKLARFKIRLHLVGTDFQKNVWRELRKIKYGRTISYKELSNHVGKPGAYQAVGRANGENPIPIIIPCHRVIGHNKDLRGYAAGIKTKEFLLRLEGALPV